MINGSITVKGTRKCGVLWKFSPGQCVTAKLGLGERMSLWPTFQGMGITHIGTCYVGRPYNPIIVICVSAGAGHLETCQDCLWKLKRVHFLILLPG